MKRALMVCAAMAGLSLVGASSAEAGGFGFRLNYGGHRHSGYGHSSHYRGYGRSSYYGGYRSYGRSRYHDTSHYDYHPGHYVRHYNHYDYVPGHYDYHRTGHWHR